MLHSCNTPIDLSIVFSHFVVILQHFLTNRCISATPSVKSELSISPLASRPLKMPRQPLKAFEPFERLEAFEPHWSHWRPLKLYSAIEPFEPIVLPQFNARLSGLWTECSQICQLNAHRCSGYLVVYVQWSMPAVEAPLVMYLLIYYTLANVSTKNEAIYSPTQHIVVATVTHERHRSHGQD